MTRRVRFPDSISGPMFEVVHVCTNTQSCKVIWNPCVIFLNNTICINVHPPGLFIPSLCLVNPYMFHDAIKCYYTILYSDYLRPVSVFLCGDTWWYLVPPCLWPGRASSSLCTAAERQRSLHLGLGVTDSPGGAIDVIFFVADRKLSGWKREKGCWSMACCTCFSLFFCDSWKLSLNQNESFSRFRP